MLDDDLILNEYVLIVNINIDYKCKQFFNISSFSFNEDDEELERLIALFPEGDLNTQEYIYIEDEMAEGGLTDDEIIDAVLNANKKEEPIIDEIKFMPVLEKVSSVKAKKAIDKIIRFLYKQEVKFDKVSDELKILKRLSKRIKVLVVNNLK